MYIYIYIYAIVCVNSSLASGTPEQFQPNLEHILITIRKRTLWRKDTLPPLRSDVYVCVSVNVNECE